MASHHYSRANMRISNSCPDECLPHCSVGQSSSVSMEHDKSRNYYLKPHISSIFSPPSFFSYLSSYLCSSSSLSTKSPNFSDSSAFCSPSRNGRTAVDNTHQHNNNILLRFYTKIISSPFRVSALLLQSSIFFLIFISFVPNVHADESLGKWLIFFYLFLFAFFL